MDENYYKAMLNFQRYNEHNGEIAGFAEWFKGCKICTGSCVQVCSKNCKHTCSGYCDNTCKNSCDHGPAYGMRR